MTCDQHVWVLEDSENQRFWIYRTRRKRNGSLKVIDSQAGFGGSTGLFHPLCIVVEKWYCSTCRARETEEHTIRSFDEFTDDGYAVYDWLNRKYVLPEKSTDEVKNGK